MIDSFSIPFFAAAAVGLLTLFVAMYWLPESRPARLLSGSKENAKADWRGLARTLRRLLGLALVAQFALAIFEGTFALYSQAKFNLGPALVGTAFVICGLVMAIFQAGAAGLLSGHVSESQQIGAGFGLMGASLILIIMAHSLSFVFVLVGLVALGMALISPNLAALISKRGGSSSAGAALGMQNAANSFGQATGPLLGAALFVWRMRAPYLLTGAFSVTVALIVVWEARKRRHADLLAG